MKGSQSRATSPRVSPATKLPWKDLSPATEMMRSHLRETNLAYAVHAVNAYPGLIEALKALTFRAEEELVDPQDVAEIGTAKLLLAQLGETA